MAIDSDALATRIFRSLMEFMPLFHRHLMPSLAVDLKESMGLGRSHAKALIVLANGGPATPTELGRSMAMTKACLTGLVDELEAQGLVERVSDEKDRRKSVVSPTELGIKRAGEVMDAWTSSLGASLATHAPDDLERVAAGIEQLVEALKRL